MSDVASSGVSETESEWRVLLVEDEADMRNQIREFFSDEKFDSRKLSFQEVSNWDEAFKSIRERKADLIILDIFRGEAAKGGERVGEEVLKEIIKTGFVPVVIHTNLPEGLDTLTNKFVRLVPKTEGLPKLRDQIQDLFRIRIPQIHRAIFNHLDSTLRDYMWNFVGPKWKEFESFADKPDFLRLIVQRLALTFAREGVERMTTEVFGTPVPQGTDPENVHPAEYYIKPPICSYPLLGDIRVRGSGTDQEYLVVLWPSCDMVSIVGRPPKVDRVLCAKALPLKIVPPLTGWLSSENKENIRKMIQNQSAPPGNNGSPDRYHYLPGVWEIPHLIIDFQALEHISLQEVNQFSCLASLASPFAEVLGARFGKYIGRIGTPDLDVSIIIEHLKDGQAGGPTGTTITS